MLQIETREAQGLEIGAFLCGVLAYSATEYLLRLW